MGVCFGLYMYDVVVRTFTLAISSTDEFLLFACESNISGTAERVCAKFTGKTCLVPLSDHFECQGQRSDVRDKNALRTSITPGSERMVRSAA